MLGKKLHVDIDMQKFHVNQAPARRGRGTGGQNGSQADEDTLQSSTPTTSRLHGGSLMTTLQLTKQHPATGGVVERGGRVTTARRMTMRVAPGCSPLPT
jgi:hypothetical protein